MEGRRRRKKVGEEERAPPNLMSWIRRCSHVEPKPKQKPHDKVQRERDYITQGHGKQKRATHVGTYVRHKTLIYLVNIFFPCNINRYVYATRLKQIIVVNLSKT